jgi:enoyl-CoA hydratase
MDYSSYEELRIRRAEPGILEIVMRAEPGKLSVTTARMHAEMARVWLDIDRDPDTRVAILRGEGRGFSAGGDLAMVEEMTHDFEVRARVWREAKDLVYNLINCSKLVVSAMHGPAVGAGLVAGLLADISIASRNARLIDGHTRLGVAAGDHAAIVWPLLCGMAKAKYYLLLCESITGEEAERLGLISMACDEEKLQETASGVARKLAAGAQTALRWTKYSLNNWLRMAGPAFDASLEGGRRLSPREAQAGLSRGAEGLLTRDGDEPHGHLVPGAHCARRRDAHAIGVQSAADEIVLHRFGARLGERAAARHHLEHLRLLVAEPAARAHHLWNDRLYPQHQAIEAGGARRGEHRAAAVEEDGALHQHLLLRPPGPEADHAGRYRAELAIVHAGKLTLPPSRGYRADLESRDTVSPYIPPS